MSAHNDTRTPSIPYDASASPGLLTGAPANETGGEHVEHADHRPSDSTPQVGAFHGTWILEGSVPAEMRFVGSPRPTRTSFSALPRAASSQTAACIRRTHRARRSDPPWGADPLAVEARHRPRLLDRRRRLASQPGTDRGRCRRLHLAAGPPLHGQPPPR